MPSPSVGGFRISRLAHGMLGRYQATSDTSKMAPVQCRGNFAAVKPGCAKLFKRRWRTPSDGDAGILQDFNPRVEDGTLGGAEIW